MEGSPEPQQRRSRERRFLLVLVVGAVVVAAGFVVYWEFIRPRTIAEVFAFDHFAPGSAIAVQGTITGIYRENTTYGPKVALQLDGGTECNAAEVGMGPAPGQVFGDPNATYSIGQTFQTTLHFQSYTINGDAAVSAPELACPFPLSLAAIRVVLDAVSRVDGLILAYNSTEPGGWLDYGIFTPNALRYNLSILPVALRKSAPVPRGNPQFPTGSAVDSVGRWNTLAGIQYIGILGSSLVFPIVDQMRSLADGTSANGSLRFVDTNGDRMLDDGDRLDIRMPPTSTANSWDTYLLEIGVMFFENRTYVGDAHYILNGPDGPLESSLSGQPAMVDLAWAGDQPGPPIRSALRVSGFPFGTPPPTTSVSFQLYDLNANLLLSGNLTDLPLKTVTGVTLSFTDGNSDGRLDAGDLFTLTGAANRSGFNLRLLSDRQIFGDIRWILGYGVPAPFSSVATFTVQGSGPWRMTANVPGWSPEFALNRTLRATLTESGHVVIANASLVNGTVGAFPTGTLNFTDADGDGYLSTGDYFTLNGNLAASYDLRLTILFGQPFSTVLA